MMILRHYDVSQQCLPMLRERQIVQTVLFAATADAQAIEVFERIVSTDDNFLLGRIHRCWKTAGAELRGSHRMRGSSQGMSHQIKASEFANDWAKSA